MHDSGNFPQQGMPFKIIFQVDSDRLRNKKDVHRIISSYPKCTSLIFEAAAANSFVIYS